MFGVRNHVSTASVSLGMVLLKHVCPRCGKGKIYQGLLTITKPCSACQLPLQNYRTEDGPAFFVMLIVPTMLAILAAILQHWFQPPLWVHAVVALFVGLALSLYGLRAVKAVMLALQYRVRGDHV